MTDSPRSHRFPPHSTAGSPSRGRRAIGVLAAAYLALATLFAVEVPLWEAPDAVWHYAFVAHLAAGHGLPTRADEGVDAPWRQQGSQPPLYYLLTAPLVALVRPDDADTAIRYNPHAAVGVAGPGGNVNRMVHHAGERTGPWRGTVLAARLVGLAGVAFGLVAVVATWAFARTVFPARPAVALAAAGVVAFNPELLFLSGAIGNDVAIAAAGALVLWRAGVVLRDGATARTGAWLGAACGIALLTKLSGLWLLPAAAGVLVWAAWRGGAAPIRTLARSAAWLGLTATLVAGWWYARNLVLFGDPTGLPLMLNVMQPRELAPTWRELAVQLAAVWRSYWAVFGWFNIPAPSGVYAGVTVLALVGLGSLVALVARRRLARGEVEGVALAALTTGLLVAALVAWAQVRYPQGRLLFPAAPALALLVAAGWTAGLGERAATRVAAALAVALAALSAGLLYGVILPSYAAPPAEVGAARSDAAGGAVAFADPGVPGAGLALVGPPPAPPAGALHPGGALDLTFRWRVVGHRPPATDYSIFLHLVDAHDLVVAQRDSYPASGNAPTTDWLPGRVYTDRHRFVIPPTAEAPCDCRLVMGVYDAATGRRLVSEAHGETLDLGPVRIEPAAGPDGVPNPLGVPFGDDIVLAGYALGERAAPPGSTVPLTLYWKARRTPPVDYKVSIQLRRGADETWGQRDEQPADGARSTSEWAPGEVVEDVQPVPIYPDAPPGVYTLHVKLYDRETGRPLPVNLRDFELTLGGFRVLAR